MIKKIVFLFFLLISNIAFSSNEKIALIIGNSKYQNLGSLNNTINDAKLIEKSLKEIGYKTQIVLDANEQQARKAIKNFAIESENSNIALVFYAGHGAQVLGENYLLPIDIDIPKRESDIQLSGIKVDDIVNTIHSKVKVVFLDACRDNPSLIKSLSKGRGSYQGGLAPPKNTSFTDNSSGIFIAYATDSGNVALDGNDKDSPFSLALAKYIKEPISVDDMFSKVTKEVRQKTNNAQKPYKYASLEGVVCLTNKCGQLSDLAADSKVSESASVFTNEQSKIAMLTKDYLERGKAQDNTDAFISNLSLPSKWMLISYDSDKDIPNNYWYVQPSSVSKHKNITTIKTKFVPVSPKSTSKEVAINSWAIDCNTYKTSVYENQNYDLKGNLIRDFKANDPEFISLDYEYSKPGTLGYMLISYACNPGLMVQPVDSNDLNSDKWHRLFSFDGGDNYFMESSVVIEKNKVKLLFKEDYSNEQKLSNRNAFKVFESYNPPLFKQIVFVMEFECGATKYKFSTETYYDNKNEPFFLNKIFSETPLMFDIKSTDPSFFLMKKFCST